MKKQNFLQLIHKLWVADFGNMDDYMDCLWALMLKNKVTWKSPIELEEKDMSQYFFEGMETDSLFEVEVNDKSKDHFENFEKVCERYMDFSQLENDSNLYPLFNPKTAI